MQLEEPAIPYQPWHAPDSEWPVRCGRRSRRASAPEQRSSPGLPEVTLDKERHFRLAGVRPAPRAGADCLDFYRRMFADARAG